jgi:Flp pilus assembly protein TadD
VSAVPLPSDPSEPSAEEYRQRALLFADLGRYDDAADEIAAGLTAAPADSALLATLARIHLAAGQPAEALMAADRAVAAAPEQINPLVVRAMALTDNSRYGDAAGIATEVLHRWPADPYALRTGAALLSEARNGQQALNAAWEAVRLAPADGEAHLVLAVVAARLRLFDLAQRAYGEALDLDAGISEAQRDVGIVRLERRRWAQALEALADEASLGTAAGRPDSPERLPAESPDAADPLDPYRPSEPHWSPEPPVRSEPSDQHVSPEPPVRSGPPEPSARSHRSEPVHGEPTGFELPVIPPSKPVLDPSEDSAAKLRQALLYGANGILVAAVLTSAMATVSGGVSRVWAGMIGVLLLVAVPVWLSRQLTEPLSSALNRLRARNRRRAVAVYAALSAPIFIVLYAVIGSLMLLITTMLVAAVAELLFLARRS